MEFLRSVLAQDEAIAADGTFTYDLPTNPLSHLALTIKALNVADEATWENIADLVTKCQVLYKGTSVINLNGQELAALNAIMLGHEPIITNCAATDDGVRSLGLIVPFGRRLYNPGECYPATKAADLKLQLDLDIATLEADGLIMQIETIELPAATPSHHLKCVKLAPEAPAVGENDVPLPIGNIYAGILLWGTTIPLTTSWTTTIDKVKLLANSLEHYYSSTNWESLHADLIHRLGMATQMRSSFTDDDFANFALLDFDPYQANEFLFNTAGLSDLKLRITAGDTNVFEVFPIELVSVTGRPAPPASRRVPITTIPPGV